MNFLKKLSFNKLTLSLFSFAILSFLFFPLIASAEIPIIGGFINAAQKDLVQAILGAIFGIMTSIPLMLLNVALDLLNWVASGNFLVVGFTNMTVDSVGYNPVVATGWSFVRNLANVVLIFGLVLIALSIILGYQETKAKKMLVDFILIAILINFTPVICGFAIDVAKIVMDLLLKGGVAPDVANFMASKLSNSNLADLPTMFVLAAFCIFSAVVYFLFALLFLVRIVMLWILIILSPIAFATKVLPQSRYIMSIFPRICQWDEWWTNFLQWTFMGIPAAGAIWLSNIAMGQIASNPNAFVSIPNGTALTGILGLLFSYTIPFIILVVGFFTTLDQGGAAGGALKGIANKAVGVIKGAPVGAALGFASGAAAGASQGGAGGFIKGGFKGSAQGTLTGGEQEKQQLNRWYQRNVKERLGVTTAGTTAGEEGKDINKISATYKNLDDEKLEKEMQQVPVTEKNIKEKMAAIITAVERGNKIRNEEIAWIEKHKDYLSSKGADLHKVANYAPELAPQITGASVKETVTGMPTTKFADIRAESFNAQNAPEILDAASEKQIFQMLDKGSPDQLKNLKNLESSLRTVNYRTALLANKAVAQTQAEKDEIQKQIDHFMKICNQIANF
jgi:hypothetical protein